ncbi:zinc-dependent metalloprotease [Niabella sp. CJ426]|uniref:zinc-dependent metalloprotease n=1 Tax=Niabella sp. CJ426 TaxID=3393740 RepID=UPI003D02EA8A
MMRIVMIVCCFFITTQIMALSEYKKAQAKKDMDDGFLEVQVIDNKYYFHIPDTVMGRMIMIVSRVNSTLGNGKTNLRPGDQVTDIDGRSRFIRFEKMQNGQVGLYQADYNGFDTHVKKPDTVLNASSFSKRQSSCVDVTDLLKGNGKWIHGAAKSINEIGSINGHLRLLSNRQHFYDSTVLLNVTTLFILLPAHSMKPRQVSPRVGFFKTQSNSGKSYANRWRLEPRQEDIEHYRHGQLVQPSQPIVFYIDSSFPDNWIPYIKRGVENWNVAFEQAGFENAVVAQVAPTAQQDSSWSIHTCTAAIVLRRAGNDVALSPHIRDPRSGEILQSRINIDDHILDWYQRLYFIQAAANDVNARKIPFDDSLRGRLLEGLVTHEVGHALGLTHNMGASYTVPVEKLRNKKWIAANGITSSVMDYVRYNYVAQVKDGLTANELMPQIGIYDKFAIEWAYRIFSFDDEVEDEKKRDSWLSKKIKNKRLWNGADPGELMPSDPRSKTEDVGDDDVSASVYGMKNLEYVTQHMGMWLDGNEAAFKEIRQGIGGYNPKAFQLGQYTTLIFNVVVNIGGQYHSQNGEKNKEKAVPAAVQKRAIAFLNDYLFKIPHWLTNTHFNNSVEKEYKQTDIFQVQRAVLERLLTMVLFKLPLSSQHKRHKNQFYAEDLLKSLQFGIWAELESGAVIDKQRQQLQSAYLSILSTMATSYGKRFTPKPLKNHVAMLNISIARAIEHSKNTAATTHLKTMKEGMSQVLKAITD